MTRLPVSAAVLALVAGCANATTTPPHATAPPRATASGRIDLASAALAGEAPPAEAPRPSLDGPGGAVSGRQPGDFVVFRFSGRYRKGPLTLTERVIARDDAILTVDFTLVESVQAASGTTLDERTLRARIDTRAGGRGEVFDVARLDPKGGASKASLAELEAMMAKTIVVADANERTTGTERITVRVGPHGVSADKTTYRVVLGAQGATMSITQSDAFAWGDLGSEIVTDDGALFYRAELVDAGTSLGALASTDDDP